MIYLSGKITGTDDYLERFQQAENYVRLNYDDKIINPAKVTQYLPELSYQEYIKISICLLEMCDTIFMIDGWKTSAGAELEYQFAIANNYKFIY